MCGICGYLDLSNQRKAEKATLGKMTNTLVHRGPDSSGYYLKDSLGLGFRRLSIIDLDNGDQPLYNEDRSIVLICNGEIFNYRELKKDLLQKGHLFRTNTDVEVLIHLYEEEGVDFLTKLNGQFAFALYDQKFRRLLLARDHFGINPLFHTVVNDTLIFGSEIKAILAHPSVTREVDLTGLDQTLTFPGLISPRTMFAGIESLKAGHYMLVEDGSFDLKEFWDLDYPRLAEKFDEEQEGYYIERLGELLTRSVDRRLQADVPVGFYLSGGIDSSVIAALIRKIDPGKQRSSFSITFADEQFSEAKYQRKIAEQVKSIHHEIRFDWLEISERLRKVIYHCESPLKESYNTASLALSEAAKDQGISVVLTGEGADELFAGYVGYRFDQFRRVNTQQETSLENVFEDELRSKIWGDRNFFYEKDYYSFRDLKRALYSGDLNSAFHDFDCLNFDIIDKEKIRDRHYIHQRSYVDFKLRMSDHLLSDHGDKMALANGVEARYPFLDTDIVNFVRQLPPHLKLNGYTEKYILKKVAKHLLPREIIDREKYAFVAPGSPYLLRQKIEWIQDLLSFDRIKREGYFNPQTVEKLKTRYLKDGFRLNTSFETDLLIVILTFGIFLELFKIERDSEG